MRFFLTGLALTCVFVTGCAHETGTEPSVFPPRPVEIRTDSLAPCSMLSSDQQRELGLVESEERTVPVNGQPSPACIWLSDTDLGYGAQTVPIGAEVAVTEQGASVIEVSGFGAVRSVVRTMTGGAPTCQVTVDAGPNRSIRVQAQATGIRPRSDEEMCRIATEVTGMVMATVVAYAR